MSGPGLAGRTVVVTRGRDRAGALARALVGLGATVVELPAIEIVDPADGGRALTAATDALVAGEYAWVAVTSSNAADRLFASLGDRRPSIAVHWAAVGPATAAGLEDRGVTCALIAEPATAAALVDAFPAPPSGDVGRHVRVLFPRAEHARATLASGLASKGWLVDEVVAYRTVAGSPPADALTAACRADAVLFTSPSTVTRTLELLGPGGVPPLVVTIGPVTTAAARGAGLTVAGEADPHTADGLALALTRVLPPVGSDGSTAGGAEQ